MIEFLIAIPFAVVGFGLLIYAIKGISDHFEEYQCAKKDKKDAAMAELYDSLRVVVGDEMQLHIREMRELIVTKKIKSPR